MVIDYQAILAVLTIACGIFLAGRSFGKIELKLELKKETEDEYRQQLTEISSKLDAHLLRSIVEESVGEQSTGEYTER